MKFNKSVSENYEFCLFAATNDLDFIINIYYNFIIKFFLRYKKFTIYNFKKSNIKDFSKKYPQLSNKNFKILNVDKNSNFLKYTDDKQIFAIDAIPRNLSNFHLRKVINKKNIFLIFIMNFGLVTSETSVNLKKYNLRNFIFNLYKFFEKIIFRLFILFCILPKTHFYFESRYKVVNKINNSLIRKFINQFPSLQFLLNYKKIELINSNSFEYLKKKKYKVKNNILLFLDGNYNHKEILVREGQKIKKNSEEYINALKYNLSVFQKIFRKPVEIALHPSSDILLYKKKFPSFKITQGHTCEKIYSSSVVFFHESSSIRDAIILNKRIICFNTNLLGNYVSNLIDAYIKNLKVPYINIDKIENIKDIKKIISKKNSNINKNNLKKYSYENLIPDGNNIPSDKVLKKIKEFILNE